MPAEKKDDKGEGQFKLADDPGFKELTNAVKGLAILVQQGQKAQQKLTEDLSGLTKTVSEIGTRGGTGRTDGDDDVNPDAINDLDNAGLLKIILSEVGKVMEEKVKGISDQLNKTNTSIETNELKKEYARLSGDIKDFKDWGTEMATLSKQHPTLSLEDLYHKARRDNPTKAAELDIKYKDAGKDKKDQTGKFMGLMPTSTPHDAGNKEKVTPEEAGNKAWDDVVQQFPALATPGDE